MSLRSHVTGELRFRARSSCLHLSRWVVDRIGDKYFDKRFGIESSERRSLQDLGVEHSGGEDYQPVSYSDFRKLISLIPVCPDDVFLDFGCGMGRALCLAALHPFRSVRGVEISPELCALAQQNIARVRPQLKCQDVRIFNCDAALYEVPSDVTVIYFFNPFGTAVREKVLNNILRSFERAPRTLRMLFYGTCAAEIFRREMENHDWLTLQREVTLPTGALGLLYCTPDLRGGR